MSPLEFQKIYPSRTRAYSRLFARKWGVSGQLAEDLHQACWIAICETLPYWKESLGPDQKNRIVRSKSAFNWCAGQMRKQMERVIRSHYGLKPTSKCRIQDLAVELDSNNEPFFRPDLDSAIDLKAALENDPKPDHVARFVLMTVNPQDRETFARNVKLTRQAVGASVRRTKERLRLALG